MALGITPKEIFIVIALIFLLNVGTWMVSESAKVWLEEKIHIHPFWIGVILIGIFLVLVKFGSALRLAIRI